MWSQGLDASPAVLRWGTMDDVNHQPVPADEPLSFPATRAAALAAWERFLPLVPEYAEGRAHVRAGHRAVSRLSPAIRHRLVTEQELVAATLAAYPFQRVEKFVQELLWRRYWKAWLDLRPSVWADYRADVERLRAGLGGYQARRLAEVEAGRSGVAIMDHFATELTTSGYLHNHARMWFAGWWVHTERLPWQLGADFFYRRLLDADPASNTLSWRWVAGIQTRGKPYLTCRSNVEKYAPELVARYPDGLDRLGDATATPAPIDADEAPRPIVPDDADAVSLPDDLPGPVGLWLHPDDLSPESATPLDGLAPRAILATTEPGRPYTAAALGDGLRRAVAHFGGDGTSAVGPIADAIVGWATAHGLRSVVALRPPVGPTADAVPEVRSRLAAVGVGLHLVWRPADVASLPWASSGYFRFWQSARDDLLGRGRRTPKGRVRQR